MNMSSGYNRMHLYGLVIHRSPLDTLFAEFTEDGHSVSGQPLLGSPVAAVVPVCSQALSRDVQALLRSRGELAVRALGTEPELIVWMYPPEAEPPAT
jgi:hypothetical protein